MSHESLKGKIVPVGKVLFENSDLITLLTHPRRTVGTVLLLALAYNGRLYMKPEMAQNLDPHALIGNLSAMAMNMAQSGAIDPENGSINPEAVNQQQMMAQAKEWLQKNLKDLNLHVDAYEFLQFNQLCFRVFGGVDSTQQLAQKMARMDDAKPLVQNGTIMGADLKNFIDGTARSITPFLGMIDMEDIKSKMPGFGSSNNASEKPSTTEKKEENKTKKPKGFNIN